MEPYTTRCAAAGQPLFAVTNTYASQTPKFPIFAADSQPSNYSAPGKYPCNQGAIAADPFVLQCSHREPQPRPPSSPICPTLRKSKTTLPFRLEDTNEYSVLLRWGVTVGAAVATVTVSSYLSPQNGYVLIIELVFFQVADQAGHAGSGGSG